MAVDRNTYSNVLGGPYDGMRLLDPRNMRTSAIKTAGRHIVRVTPKTEGEDVWVALVLCPPRNAIYLFDEAKRRWLYIETLQEIPDARRRFAQVIRVCRRPPARE